MKLHLAGFIMVSTGGLLAQQSLGGASDHAPDEQLYVYKPVPDIRVRIGQSGCFLLSELWRAKPFLVTLVFTRCAGICSPMLRSLKSAATSAGGLGVDYRILVVTFDPRDTVSDLDTLATHLGVQSNPDWMFGVASPSDVRLLAEAIGFWFRWDCTTKQYDHPGILAAVDRGRIIRMRAGVPVPSSYIAEVLQELQGKFVASYPLPGKVAFRCFQYDAARGRFSIDWGLLLMVLPGLVATLATVWVFRSPRVRQQRV
jgi:protein SCO1/2